MTAARRRLGRKATAAQWRRRRRKRQAPARWRRRLLRRRAMTRRAAAVRAPWRFSRRHSVGARAAADAGCAERAGAGDQQLRRAGGARERQARHPDQARAGARRAAGALRGRHARDRARAQRRQDAGQRPVAQAAALDRPVVDGGDLARARRADAEIGGGCRARPSSKSACAPIRWSRRCWNDSPAPRLSACAAARMPSAGAARCCRTGHSAA